MIPLIAVGALIVGAVVISVFWKEIKTFIVDSVKKIKTVIIPSAIVGFRTFLETGSVQAGLIKALQRFYTKNTQGQWQETTVTRTISDKEVPKDILAKANANKYTPVDISNEVQKELKLEI